MAQPFPQSGYRPPKAPDPRNLILEKAQAIKPYPPSFKTDLTPIGVFDQEKIPDCVENAVTLVKKYHIYKVSQTVTSLSRRFLASLTVEMDGFPISNGTSLLNALKVAQKTGICESQYFPDNHTLPEEQFSSVALIPQTAYDNAKTHRISSYAFLSDHSEQGLKNAINQNGVVIVGLKIDKNWWTDVAGNVTWEASKILPLRTPIDAASESGHAVVLYAYDEHYFYCWNSFGTEWGYNGHGWFGKEYLPFIYEAATILDLTDDQRAGLQQAQEVLQAVDKVVDKPLSPLQIGIIEQILASVSKLLSLVFK